MFLKIVIFILEYIPTTAEANMDRLERLPQLAPTTQVMAILSKNLNSFIPRASVLELMISFELSFEWYKANQNSFLSVKTVVTFKIE